MSTTNLLDANRQWAARPYDQRYEDLPSLAADVDARQDRSKEYAEYRTADLYPQFVAEGPLAGAMYVVKWGKAPVVFTHWSFAQYNALVGGPNISWLRAMPADVAAGALISSIQHRGRVGLDSRSKLYVTPPGAGDPGGELRAVTSPTYGRIYDAEVVAAVMRMNRDGRWTVPLQAYGGKNSKLATTLYASDRDVWLFLVDESRPVEVDGELYYRGFMVWNSEVGACTFGLKTFLYRYICGNRIVWDAIQVRELTLRHTVKAPERFITEAAPVLAAYSEMGTLEITDAIHAAKRHYISKDMAGAEGWLRARGLTNEVARRVVNLAQQDGGAEPDANGNVKSTDPTSVWNLSQGLSAFARSLPNQDERVALEYKAGEFLALAGTGRR